MINEGYLLGLDIGSSSVKASLISIESGKKVASGLSPVDEMPMVALHPGWAEQDPELWWENAVISIKQCFTNSSINPLLVKAIGIAYQMHGLVIIDKDHKLLRNSIIWCDSRSVQIGDQAFQGLGKEYCLQHLLNSPGNFTASKLKWVKANEPEIYNKIYKAMLPGDFIAMKLTGQVNTTDTGLSEGVFWDFKERKISATLLNYYSIDASLIPNVVSVFSVHGQLSKSTAAILGLQEGIKVSYRSGDQPNNAFSLNVLDPGETAATAGTSGVIYSITDKNIFDKKSRVNAFVHVNNNFESQRNGILLCVNGTGSQNSWLRKNISGSVVGYDEMNALASKIPIGSDGVVVLPFGNGAERIFENKETTAAIQGLNFNTHHQGHIFRAAQEGIVFALKYGFDILNEIGLHTKVIRAGNANMFLSPLFREAFTNTIGVPLELYDTDGATGAAIGAGIGAGIYSSTKEALQGLKQIAGEEPVPQKMEAYNKAWTRWQKTLKSQLQTNINTPTHQHLNTLQ